MSGSTWRCPAEEPLSVPHNRPGRAAWPDKWEPGEGAARRPAGAKRHKPVSSFLNTASAQPWGCLPGRQGVGEGTPSHLPQDRPLPGILAQGGWGTLSVSHEAFLSPPPRQHPGPRVWVWEGVGGWQITHFRPPCLLSPAFCPWGPFLWRMRTHSFQEVIPKPLARDPTEPETRGAERSKTAWNT